VSAKVSIVKCRTYDREDVRRGVKKALDLLGGITQFIKKGDRVLIKPNLLSARPVEDNVCTNLEVIRAVVRLVREAGGMPLIGDNPGGSVSPKKVYEDSGIAALAAEEKAELKEVENVKMVNGIPMASYLFECDKIINLPKMKTHSLMGLTGAVKNMYGMVAGLYKTQRHKDFPAPADFAKVLADVFEIKKPALSLMDGIISMDREGPSSGRLRNTWLLIASEDGVALDSVFSALIGMKPLDLLTTREAHKRGLGEADLGNIEILGGALEDHMIEGFELPGTGKIIGILGPFAGFAASFVRFQPRINQRRCRKCRVCLQSCPVYAIIIDEKRQFIDPGKCLRCMCCHEVCPYKAIELKRNALARAFGL